MAAFALKKVAYIRLESVADFIGIRIIKSVTATHLPGIYEVVMGKNVAYVEESGRYFLFGHLFDMQTQTDMTEGKVLPEKTAAANKIDFSKLPFDDAVVTVRGDGSRKVAIFSDPDCPYCKQFDPAVAKLLKAYPNDLGLVIKLLPFKGQTSAKAAQYSLTLWQQDPARFLALHDKLMSKQGMLTEADINKALAATGNVALKPEGKATEELRNSLRIGTLLGVQGTPATLIGNQLVPGALPYEQLEQLVKTELAKLG